MSCSQILRHSVKSPTSLAFWVAVGIFDSSLKFRLNYPNCLLSVSTQTSKEHVTPRSKLEPWSPPPPAWSSYFPSSERSTLFFLKLKIFYKLSLLPVLNFSSFFSTPQPQSSGKTHIRSLSPPGVSITCGYNLNSSHGPSSQGPVCLSIQGLSLFFCSFAHSGCSCHLAIKCVSASGLCICRPLYREYSPRPRPTPPAPKGLRLTLPLHSGPCSDVSTSKKPSQRPRVESHMPSPSTLTSCLLRPVLFVFTTSLTLFILFACWSRSSIPTLLECMQIVGTLSVLLILYPHISNSTEDTLELNKYLVNEWMTKCMNKLTWLGRAKRDRTDRGWGGLF